MPAIQVKKVVAICFLEAVKTTLEHLGAHRLALSEQGAPAPADLTRVYGDVRRMRDYLQRSTSGYGDVVELDLDDSDSAVLVACCRRAVETMDVRLVEAGLPEDERNWLQKKQQVVAHWAVEIAAKPLLELPLKRGSHAPSEVSRQLAQQLQQKAYGALADRPKIVAPNSAPPSRMAGVPSFGDEFHDVRLADSSPDLGAAPAPPPSRGPAAPGAARPAAAAGDGHDVPPLFDHQRIADPRLRALVGVDQRAYQRAVAGNDHRLATILMASVLEAAVLDHVFAHRAEFAVGGAPDAWNVQELLLQALGERVAPKDRSLAYHLFAARNLLRPAVQFVAPMIVTAASFEVLKDFVQRCLRELGYGVSTRTLPPGAVLGEESPLHGLSLRDHAP